MKDLIANQRKIIIDLLIPIIMSLTALIMVSPGL